MSDLLPHLDSVMAAAPYVATAVVTGICMLVYRLRRLKLDKHKFDKKIELVEKIYDSPAGPPTWSSWRTLSTCACRSTRASPPRGPWRAACWRVPASEDDPGPFPRPTQIRTSVSTARRETFRLR